MIANFSRKLFAKLCRKSFRDEYVAEGVRTGIAYQIRALRDQREWSQKVLAEKLDKPQSVVSRLEDPDYGKLSVQTLLEIAKAFDVAVVVRFVSLPDFLRTTHDVRPSALEADSFDEGRLLKECQAQFAYPQASAGTTDDHFRVTVSAPLEGAQMRPPVNMINILPVNAMPA